jgi:hypothetical protein
VRGSVPGARFGTEAEAGASAGFFAGRGSGGGEEPQATSTRQKWKSKYKIHFPVWLEMLGHVDAFISLGNYSFNNSDFVTL